MLLSKHCPYTGVVNFYDTSEPHIAIGSITRCGTSVASARYTWRFYGADSAPAGNAPDRAASPGRKLSPTQMARTDLLAAASPPP